MKGEYRLSGIVVVIALALEPTPALAYLDPSTGSMLVSALIGIFASLALAIKTYWYRLKRKFRGKGSNPPRDEPASGATGEGR